jgi:DNA-binding transcriptional ArsR family regulator
MEPNIALPASLIGDPTRAAILMALCDGRAHPASALAYAANVTAQLASNHLAKLVDGGLLAMEKEGRHRYYRLANLRVATALEALAGLAPPVRSLDTPLSSKGRELRFARVCYNHLAGRLGTAVTAALESRDLLRRADANPTDAKIYRITGDGHRWFHALAIDVDTIKPTRRGLARPCLDWTERRHHLAGPLGVRLLSRMVDLRWLERTRDSRAVVVTAGGAQAFRERLAIDCATLPNDDPHHEHRPTPASVSI